MQKPWRLSDESYDNCVSAIYCAAAGHSEWDIACGLIAQAMDLTRAHIIGVDKTNGRLLFSWNGGSMAKRSFFDYAARYHALNPHLPFTMQLNDKDWFRDHLHFDEQYVGQSPFYQEFAIPYGGRYLAAAKLFEQDDLVVMTGMLRSANQCPLDDAELSELTRLRRHLRDAFQIHFRLRDVLHDLNIGHDLLNALPYPVFITGLSGEIVYQNHRGSELCEAQELVTTEQSTLKLLHQDADTLLRENLQAFTRLQARGDGTGPTKFVIPIGRPITRAAIIGFVIDPDTALDSLSMDTLVLLMFHELDHQPGSDPFIVAKVFDLTPAEAMVATQLANGNTTHSIAQSRGVSEHTVRAQLRSIYVKLNVNSLPELTRSLLGIPQLSVQTEPVRKTPAGAGI